LPRHLWLEALSQKTMISSNIALVKPGNTIYKDVEVELVNNLATALAQAGVRADRIDVANFYVALKHRRMVVLAGRAGIGKATLVKCLAGILAGASDFHQQVLAGHAWYAGRSTVNSNFISMHTSLITEKFLSIVEEALQPENAQQVFVVGLTHITPAELRSFFTEVAFQIQHYQIMHIGDTHLSAPVPFPSNLLLIGTLDTTDFDCWDEDLLSGATVIEWQADVTVPRCADAGELQDIHREFLRFSLRNSEKACEKLLSVVAGTKQPLKAVMLVQNVLQSHRLGFSPALLDEVVIYLANAWSVQGNGLFNPSLSRNLAIASDLALAQLVLPHYFMAKRSSKALQAELYSILDEQMPRSRNFIKRHFGKEKKDGREV
jgi:energy-coupling factor transporter ATP-binding protein EcfA2